MFVRRTIETNEEARIRPSKTYQSFIAAAGSHRELSFRKRREELHHKGIKTCTYFSSCRLMFLRAKRERIQRYKFSHRDTVCNKINNRGPVSTRVYQREVQESSRIIQRKGELHHKISEFHPRFHNIRSCRAVFHHLRCSITRGKVPVPAIQVKGILCRHSLSILSFERVDNVAPKYILERWSKNIKRRHTHIKSS
ncbi:hypothetical protein Ahy_A03g010105 [Arachis hypogaea]|uniref:Protein FAR1-RELATED SEQUENCE n=1 Tax=Arachis hypogaea TaxID=3818 RepID=A0A445DLM9_ARAHY|nr:hypothetical protein Ahy_A03g010105 [Arachis hypogaea]